MKDSFQQCIEDIINNKKFNKLKNELHHGITRYDHSYRVAKWTHMICKLLKMKKYTETTRAALLHDFYVNEDLTGNGAQRLGRHPAVALDNSLKYYDLDNIQKDIIKTHMFPCNLTLPKYKESWLVSAIDKIVGTYEMLRFKSVLYMGIYFLFLFEMIRISR